MKRVRSLIHRYGRIAFIASVLVIGLAGYVLGYRRAAEFILASGTFIGTLPIAWRMIREIFSGKIGIDIIAITAIVASLALGEYLAGAVVLLMLTSGEALEDYAQARAKKELTALLKRSPKLAHRKHGKSYDDITVAQIVVGDTLIIKPGEVVPADGKVVAGSSHLDEAALTGESLPVSITKGALVLSGAVNLDELIEIQVLRDSRNSQYEQIVKLVREAASSRSPLVRLADQFSIPFTLITFIIAGLAWYFTGQAIRALEVLVVATPCPLLIATPVAIVAGMSRAARHGIIVKDGGSLEVLSRVRTIAFDKSGTLTKGQPEVSEIRGFGMSQANVLKYAASVEAGSAHIFAAVVTKAAKARQIGLVQVKNVEEVPGRGVMARVGATTVLVGNYAFLAEQKIQGLVKVKHVRATDILVARAGTLAGVITFADEIRPEAQSTVRRLDQLGIRNRLMLTGDKQSVAERIGHSIGISRIYAELLPKDKLSILRRLKPTARPVAMVGDGINDAPTLAAADVGIALGARGSTAASESANVVIMLDDLSRVPLAVEISQRTTKVAMQSIYFGISVSVVLMLIAAIGGIRPVIGAILQEGLDVVVILNALRARHGAKAQSL